MDLDWTESFQLNPFHTEVGDAGLFVVLYIVNTI